MKLIEVIAHTGSVDTVAAIAEHNEVPDFRPGVPGENDMQEMRLLVPDDKVQTLLDALQGALGSQPDTRIHVIPVDISLPRPPRPSARRRTKLLPHANRCTRRSRKVRASA